MNMAGIEIVVLQVSIFLIVFSLGLESTFQDAVSLFRRPRLLARSFISMNIVMPLVAAIMVQFFGMPPAVKIALVMLSLSPVPPILPQRQAGAGGRTAYVHGLLTAMALLSIVVVPVAVEVLGRIYGHDVHVGPLLVARVVGKTVLLPLGLGILIRLFVPGWAAKGSKILAQSGNLLLLAALIPLLVFAWRPIASLIGNGTLMAMIVFAGVALVVGHTLGGPHPSERSVLALATASRHPGLAIAVATATFPAQRRLEVAAILLYVVVSFLVVFPYVAWRKRRLARSAETSPTRRAA
ncbi:MAG TPA: Na+-dependent transporter [Candidatus Angelobacter sp.]|nr:Na+-dependent transporter [Candidatus Angelobacter sp.]